MRVIAPVLRHGFPFIIPQLAEDGLPFQLWDRSTLYNGTPSKYPDRMVRVYGDMSEYCLKLNWEQLFELCWRVRKVAIDISTYGAVNLSVGGSSSRSYHSMATYPSVDPPIPPYTIDTREIVFQADGELGNRKTTIGSHNDGNLTGTVNAYQTADGYINRPDGRYESSLVLGSTMWIDGYPKNEDGVQGAGPMRRGYQLRLDRRSSDFDGFNPDGTPNYLDPAYSPDFLGFNRETITYQSGEANQVTTTDIAQDVGTFEGFGEWQVEWGGGAITPRENNVIQVGDEYWLNPGIGVGAFASASISCTTRADGPGGTAIVQANTRFKAPMRRFGTGSSLKGYPNAAMIGFPVSITGMLTGTVSGNCLAYMATDPLDPNNKSSDSASDNGSVPGINWTAETHATCNAEVTLSPGQCMISVTGFWEYGVLVNDDELNRNPVWDASSGAPTGRRVGE